MQTKDGYLMVGARARRSGRVVPRLWGIRNGAKTRVLRPTSSAWRTPRPAVMNAELTTDTTEHWVEVLGSASVPCGPVYEYAQMFADPQVRHRGLVQYASDAELGEVPHIRTPVTIGDGVRVRTVAPRPAQRRDL